MRVCAFCVLVWCVAPCLRKEYCINQEVDVSDTECDDLVGWEMPCALIADQMELKVAEKSVAAQVKVEEKKEESEGEGGFGDLFG